MTQSNDMPKQAVIGVDIGGTKIAAQIADGAGWHLPPITIPTPAKEGATAVLTAVADLCKDLMTQAHAHEIDIEAVGVGAAGQIDPIAGVVLGANDNLSGWTNAPISETLSQSLDLPVWVDNDVNVMALGEGRLGAGAHYDHILYIAVGTGVGGAIVQNGRIWHGAHFSAGEIGYLVAARDEDSVLTLEQLTAGPALERAYWTLNGGGPWHDLRTIADCADKGDITAEQIIKRGAYLLGTTLSPALCFVDPEVLIVGGGVPQIGPLWWNVFINAFQEAPLESTRATPVVRAELGPDAIMVGAAVMARQYLDSDVN